MLSKIVQILLLINIVYGSDVSVWEDYVAALSCNSDEGINVRQATWTYNMAKPGNWVMPNWRNYFFLVGKPLGLCTYDQTNIVSKLCQGKRYCSFTADRTVLSNACNYWMRLDISYNCLPCHRNNKRSIEKSVDLYSARFPRMVPTVVCDLTVRIAQGRYTGICPHPNFEIKHMTNRNEDSVHGAVIFATQTGFVRDQGPTVQATVSSVFILPPGQSMTYNLNMGYCTFTRRISKYNCVKQNIYWQCHYQGQYIASHDITTGHYDPSRDI